MTPKIKQLLEQASKDPFLGEFVLKKKMEDLVPLEHDGEIVGFAIPRKEADGKFRTGPIYVDPKSRKHGVASSFIKTFFSDKPGRSWIDPKNIASKKAFESAGFKKSGKTTKDGDEILEEYLKDNNYSPEARVELDDDAKWRLLDMAMHDPFLGPASLTVDITKLELIRLSDGTAAGFIMPMKGDRGYQRVGSIYIEPKWRGKGIAEDYVRLFFKDKPGQAWIRPTNIPSQKTFQSAGFYRTGRTTKANGNLYEEWVNRAATFAW